ncbi:MAG: lipopolysaccharide biosynthesis protein [Prosthecobacter sp.]|uniref:lipopolysaccharide biosynthesis protein n=1 Tax=Prosthecobacter sp. TaxID=1965333 RepID=UPI003901070C
MNYTEVKSRIWSNALSNYLRTFIGIVVGLITFRLLYQALPKESFGFWSLLWSVFGYGILLDFGFGFAAQKRVAELSVSRDWNKLSQVLSTILFFYLGIAAVLAGTVALGSHHIIRWFDVSPANHDEFRLALIVFFAAIGLAFPLGIFPEILRGQQRIRLANNITTLAMLMRLGVIAWAVHAGWSFMSIMLVALFFALAPDLVCALFALRHMPEVKLRLSLFSRSIMRETMAFSIFAYISTATNIVLGKTDQLVLGATLSVAAVALYQAGAKVAEVFAQFTKQLQDTLSPAAAHLHAIGDHAALRDLLQRGTRWSALIATPLYVLCAFQLEPLLRVLTGDAVIAQETFLVAQVLLFWFYTTTLTHSVSKRIYMMTGHERRLMWLGIGEAVANLAISITLVLIFRSVISVAVGSLIPTLIFGWFVLWPWMARDADMSSWRLIRQTLLPAWLACIPAALVLAAPHWLPALQTSNEWLQILAHGSVGGVVAALCVWRFALHPDERASLLARIPCCRRSSARQSRVLRASPTPEPSTLPELASGEASY